MNNDTLDSWKQWFARAQDYEVTPKIFKEAMDATNGNILKHIPDRFFTEELALYAIDRFNGGLYLMDIPRQFRTKAVCIMAARRGAAQGGFDWQPKTITWHYDTQVSKERYKANKAYPTIVPPESQTSEFIFEALLRGEDITAAPDPSDNENYGPMSLVPELLTEDLCYMAVGGKQGLNRLPRDKLTRELCHLAVASHTDNLQYVPPELITREMCYTAIIPSRYNSETVPPLKFMPEQFKTYELCLMAVRGLPVSLEFVPEEHKTEELCRDAFKFPNGFGRGRDAAMLPLYVPEKYLSEEFCHFIIKMNRFCFEHIPDRYKTPELCYTFCIDCVESGDSSWGSAVKKIPADILTEELCITLLEIGGIGFAPSVLKSFPIRMRTFAVCMEALRLNGEALDSVPKKLKTDEEIEEMAYKNSKRPRRP